MEERITRILERWFLEEPAMFGAACAHDIVQNCSIACPVRSGQGRIEYNPTLVAALSDQTLDMLLKNEAVRILLKHPYERKPERCCRQAVSIASDLVIGDNYSCREAMVADPSQFGLEKGRPYEWYSHRIQNMIDKAQAGADAGSHSHGADADDPMDEKLHRREDADNDLSELWDEDELMAATISEVIQTVKDWGSLDGSLAEMIKADDKARINWRNIFAGFRASILSDKRRMTRMRPNRRSGFEQMGSRKEFTTRMLIAVDVSGSISEQSLSLFYGIVNSAFKYGFSTVDVIEFDNGITKISSLKRKLKEVMAIGRGGTSYDEPLMYAHRNGYDGLMILTDGYADPPAIPEGFKTRIIWVCEDRDCYESNHKWMEKYGRVCIIELS